MNVTIVDYNSGNISSVINSFKEVAKDKVKIDTPPTEGMSDSNLIANKCDGAILIILKGMVKRNISKNSVENLKANGVNLLGIISNSTSVKSNRSESYYYDYTYSSYYADDEDKIEDDKNNLDKKNKFQQLINPLKKISKKFFDFVDN